MFYIKNDTLMMLRISSLFLLLCVWSSSVDAQEARYQLRTVAFYNIENLYDTIQDFTKNDTEFIPSGNKQWNSERYLYKLNNLAKVIGEMGVNPELGVVEAPTILGLCEVENEQVLLDLARLTALKKEYYGVCLIEGPDARGVDVALMYKKDYFTVIAEKQHHLKMPDRPDYKTRGQLVVTGLLEGDTISVVVNHWPSRRGGEKRSSPGRIAAGQLTRSIVDSLNRVYPNAKVLIMGDFNDTPLDESIIKALGAGGDMSKLKPSEMFNPMHKMHKDGLGTLAYNDVWSIFDQIILSQSLLNLNAPGYNYVKGTARVFSPKYLKNSQGRYKGYPYRTYVGDTFTGGYSDHFPVYLYLAKKVE